MKNAFKVLVLALLLTVLCCPSSFSAEFRLKDGDSVSGELMSYDGTTFRVKSKFGVLSIEASELAIIGLNTEEGIVDIVLGAPTIEDRDRVKGTIEYVREDGVKIKTDYGYIVVNPLDKATGIFLSDAGAGKAGTDATTQAATAQQTVEAKGFSFTLQECNRSGNSVTCNLLIISNGQDRELTLCGGRGANGSRFFDNLGNEYRANMVQLGDRSDRSNNSSVKKTLPAGIPIRASLGFEGIAFKANLISLLEVLSINDGWFRVQFRNVPFFN